MRKNQPRASKPKPYRAERFGILNHFGDVWTPETFETESRAAKYLQDQSAMNPTWKLGRHKVVPVRVTVSVAPSQ